MWQAPHSRCHRLDGVTPPAWGSPAQTTPEANMPNNAMARIDHPHFHIEA